jgi:capsular polysaccharide export protein
MGFEALLVGCECVCFGMPFYAGWGLTDDRVNCERREVRSIEQVFAAAYIEYTKYYNPYTQKDSDIIDTIKTIVKYRDFERKSDRNVYLFGFSRWKHMFMKPFLTEFKKENIYFINPIFTSQKSLAIRKGMKGEDLIYIWGKKDISGLDMHDRNVTRVEDGFIRSIGLGSDLTRPYSLVFDDLGIYFDPTNESRLENILSNFNFNDEDLALEKKSEDLIKKIRQTEISKYNSTKEELDASAIPPNKKVILIIGQVEDDASIRFGGNNMTNLELLKRVNKKDTGNFVIYKPHPDVTSGNRVGAVSHEDTSKYSDLVSYSGIHSVLSIADEVHTITSLTGFEALMRGKKVFTYGMPFYAGWGLTIDEIKLDRRVRNLSLWELVAGAMLIYPRYINPENGMYCSPEHLIDKLMHEKSNMNNKLKLFSKVKSYSVRRINQFLSFIR